MRKALFSAACILLAFVSCTHKEEEQKKITAVEVDPPVITVTVGENTRLTVNVQPADATYLTVEWSSSDETVAQINKVGTLKAIAPGSATVTATVEGTYLSGCSTTQAIIDQLIEER